MGMSLARWRALILPYAGADRCGGCRDAQATCSVAGAVVFRHALVVEESQSGSDTSISAIALAQRPQVCRQRVATQLVHRAIDLGVARRTVAAELPGEVLAVPAALDELRYGPGPVAVGRMRRRVCERRRRGKCRQRQAEQIPRPATESASSLVRGSTHARPANSPVSVFTHTFSSLLMYSGTCTSMPVFSLAGLLRLVALEPFISGAVSTTVSTTLVGTCRPTGASSISCT